MTPEQIFGPEYKGAEQQIVGSFDVQSQPVDIVLIIGAMQMTLLPPGGYVVRYLEGSFTLHSSPPVCVVGGDHGLHIKWKSSTSSSWSEIGFPVDTPEKQRFASAPEFSIEVTRPHRIQLVPPDGAMGLVKVRVLRYVPETSK